MCGRLAHSFGNRRPGDTVLSGGYPVCNALSRHPQSAQINGHRYRNVSKSSGIDWFLWTVLVFNSSVPPDNTGDKRERQRRTNETTAALYFACRLAS